MVERSGVIGISRRAAENAGVTGEMEALRDRLEWAELNEKAAGWTVRSSVPIAVGRPCEVLSAAVRETFPLSISVQIPCQGPENAGGKIRFRFLVTHAARIR